jgi:exonuclease-1
MGIANLLKDALLNFVEKKVTVETLVGKGLTRTAVDFSVWVHRAIANEETAVALFEGQNVTATNLVWQYFKYRLDMLESAGITAVHFVRDGANLPAKQRTDADRAEKREKSRADAQSMRDNLPPNANKDERKQYTKLCPMAVAREVWLENALCERLVAHAKEAHRKMNVSWEVALYEADAQLAHLYRLQRVDFIISEDQDIAVYGGTRVFFKLNSWPLKYNIRTGDFLDTTSWLDNEPMPRCGADCEDSKCKKCSCAVGLTRDQLLEACVLAGCDYWPGGVDGIGVKKACRLIKMKSFYENLLDLDGCRMLPWRYLRSTSITSARRQ